MSKFLFHLGMWLVQRAILPLFVLGVILIIPRLGGAQADDPSPPDRVVKLIFIHHSCGENWLADGHGNLGRALIRNNYFVSDTNYGWGPDSIGDRTDIIDWPEWFIGSNSKRYLTALYKESGENSPYRRNISDPGGENQIIMFKSCFPNSNLEGRINDPPARGDGFTISNAKAIYNALLDCFASRPDKFFLAITAPPVQDGTYAANARAFNTWLVKEWLAGYTGSNVAVFDFYNVLTGPKNHHRFKKGAIEYITHRGRNTLYYPTNGDDHPSPAGNRKATEEFIPLLNVYYHRWNKGAPTAPPPKSEVKSVSLPLSKKEKAEKESPSTGLERGLERPTPPARGDDVIDDFEKQATGWVVFSDEGKSTKLSCRKDPSIFHGGKASLCIDYHIVPESWATCSLVYSSPQKWLHARGLTVYLHAERAGQAVVIVAYQGTSPDNLSHFEFRIQTKKEAVSGWQRVDIPWDKFTQASWEGDGSARFDPAQAMGMAFIVDTSDKESKSGRLWVDDVNFLPAEDSDRNG
jgi:hypothetical protein